MTKEPLLGETSSSPSSNPISSSLRLLYVAHFLARWDARLWEFSVGLYMIALWPNSLLLPAVYGAMESASISFFGSFIGQWVQKLPYHQALRIWLLTQNFAFITAGCTVYSLIMFPSLSSSTFVLLLMLTNISGAIGVLSTLAGTILIEREWAVVISEAHPETSLESINSTLRRIDLTCKLLAPVASGFIISFVSIKASALALAIWNSVAVWIEYWLFTYVFKNIPALCETGRRKSDPDEQSSLIKTDPEEPISLISENILPKDVPFIGAWRLYLQQDVVLPGVALALLYFTVLSFGTLMTSKLEWEGIPAFVIGIARGISATIGIAATVVYPIMHSYILTLRSGLWSVWCQWACLLGCVVSIWVPNGLLSAYLLMAGVATSRLGLWMFDLSVIQQMQDHVPESDRCIVGGVQNSLQSTMELLSYLMGIIVSNPEDFWKLNLVSFLGVTVSGIIYSFYLYRVRKHLIHFEKMTLLTKIMASLPERCPVSVSSG
nr:ferroportin transporter IREG2 [Leucocroton havanensis]